MKFPEEKAKKEAEKKEAKAEKLLKDPEKVESVIEKAAKKLKHHTKGPLDEISGGLTSLFSLAHDIIAARYKQLPMGSFIAVLAGIIYFLSPLDALPDIIPLAGFVDDVAVIGLILKQFGADIGKYEEWKELEEPEEEEEEDRS